MKHMDQHTNDGDWNCDDCAHQTNSSDNLKRHLDITHHKSQKIKTPAIQEFPCSLCTLKCQDKSELENHRKRTHKSFKPCTNLPDCQYASKCIFNHSKVDSNIFVCYECGDELKTFNDLMAHRKNSHTLNKCVKFLEKNVDSQQRVVGSTTMKNRISPPKLD